MASEQNMCMTRSRFLVSGSRTSSWNGSYGEDKAAGHSRVVLLRRPREGLQRREASSPEFAEEEFWRS